MEEIANTQPAAIAERGGQAFELDRQIVAGCKAIRTAWILLAGHLREMKVHQRWKDLDYDTFGAYLASPGVDLSPSYTYALIGVYEELVINRGFEPEEIGVVEATKMAEALPAIRSGEITAEQAIADAKALSKGDLREKLRHDPKDLDADKAREVCPNCGNYWDPKKGEQ